MFLLTAELKQLMAPISGTSRSSGTPWKKQDALLVTATDTSYPKEVLVSFWGDETLAQLARLQPGDKLTVSIEINSKAYNGRYYNEVKGIRLQSARDTQAAAKTGTGTRANRPVAEPAEEAPLPF